MQITKFDITYKTITIENEVVVRDQKPVPGGTTVPEEEKKDSIP